MVVRVDGETLHVSGERDAVARAGNVLGAMLQAARSGTHVTPDDVAFSARTLAAESIPPTLFVTQRGKEIRPKTAGQRDVRREHREEYADVRDRSGRYGQNRSSRS